MVPFTPFALLLGGVDICASGAVGTPPAVALVAQFVVPVTQNGFWTV